MDSLLYIGLIELLAIEFLVLILLLIFLRRRKKPEQITDNIPIKHVDEVKQDLPKIEKIKEKRRERKKKSNIHFGKWFNSLIPRKSEQWIILVIYIAVLVIAGYFFLANIFPDKVPTLQDNFVISASSMQIFDKLNSLSIDKDSILGQKETIDNQVIRKIASAEPFNLVLNPKTPLKADSPASLELNLVTSGAGTDVYMNDKPIIPNLANYNLVADFKDEAVYVSKNLSSYYTSSSLIKGNSAQDFAYKNFPGASVYSFSTSASYIPDIEGYKKTTTAMVLIFRDNLKLGVFAEGDLQVKFTKQDLNSYVGKDEYTVEIKDLNGKSYFNKTYQDSDGDVSKSGKAGIEQGFTINQNNLPKGIYYIIFTKDKYNSGADSSIKNIQINSNKVIISGNSLPISSINFYVNVFSSKTLGLYYWHTGKDQIISVTGTKSFSITLDSDWLNKRYDKYLTSGNYNFGIPKGDLWIYSDQISPTKSTWFDIPKKNEGNLKNQDIIIIDKNKLKIDGNKIQYTEDIKISKDIKIKLQVIDEDKIYLESIKLSLK